MKRWQIILLASSVSLAAAILVGYRLGVRLLQDKIVEALGPGSRISELKVNWFTLELFGVTIDAPKAWPAARTLEAEHITIVPDLRSLLSERIRITSVTVDKPYISMLRTPGKLRIVPSLTESDDNQRSSSPAARAVTISTINLNDGVIELYDATVSRPPLKVRIEKIAAAIRDLAVPAVGKTHFELAGIVKGIQHDGQAKITGWVGAGAEDSSSRITLTGVDLVALQPYLVKKNEVQISRGALDLNLDSEVRKNKLDGKGKVVLRDLQFAPARGFFDTFIGLPRGAVIGFLKDNHNAIAANFTLNGDTDNPNFSLNESLSTRIAASMASTLGVSIKNVAEGIGTLGRKGVEGAGSVVESVGSAVKKLFGGAKK
ncbi:MAG: DUF748 domain-containing protein [Deltaproteobacteria bacterium]|nr:DUF748 domain-containing protein [Deltaproteobacteria bacterium]